MTEIFVVFEGGGSDESLLGIYSSKRAALKAVAGGKDFVVRYSLNKETKEFEQDEIVVK